VLEYNKGMEYGKCVLGQKIDVESILGHIGGNKGDAEV
jgi:hypothetical protein